MISITTSTIEQQQTEAEEGDIKASSSIKRFFYFVRESLTLGTYNKMVILMQRSDT